MPKWKYFTDEEVKGLVDDVVYKLDRARELFGSPLIITSGFRDPQQNGNVGGVQDSSHTRGLGVDIRCNDSELQKKLIWALCVAGFKRVGQYDRHVHVDSDVTKPTPAYWVGESK